MHRSKFTSKTRRLHTCEAIQPAAGRSSRRTLLFFMAVALVAVAGCVDEPGPTGLPPIDTDGGGQGAPAADPVTDSVVAPLSVFRLGEPYDVAASAGTGAGELGEALQADLRFLARPQFQLPFYYHQTWMASTYNGHSPNQNSIDLGRFSGGVNISKGAAVVASAAGTISEIGPVLSPEGDYYGDYIHIDHGVWQTRYLHIVRVASWEVGMAVERGQLLGTVGQYHDMAPHLHYTQLFLGQAVRIYFNGTPINVWKGAEKPDGSYPTQNLTSNNAPTGCTVTGNTVKCAAGAAVRAVAECLILAKQMDYIRRGSWVPAKVASKAQCGNGHRMMEIWYEVS